MFPNITTTMTMTMHAAMDHLTFERRMALCFTMLSALVVNCAVTSSSQETSVRSVEHTLLDWVIFAFVASLTSHVLFGGATHDDNDSHNDNDTHHATTPTMVAWTAITGKNFWVQVACLVLVGGFVQVTGLLGWATSLAQHFIVPLLHRSTRFVLDSFTNSSVVSFTCGMWQGVKEAFVSSKTWFWEAVENVKNVFANGGSGGSDGSEDN